MSKSKSVKKEAAASKRFLFSAVFVGMVAVAVVIFEIVLRIAGYGINTEPFVKVKIGNKSYFIDNKKFINKYYPAGSDIQTEQKNLFSADKPKGVLRGFIVGGSTAQGYPYGSNQSFGYFLKDNLMNSGRFSDVEIINVGYSAMSSYYVRDVSRKIAKYKPDFIVIYSGHNEYYGTIGWLTGGSHFTKLMNMQLKEFRIIQLAMNILTPKRANTGETLMESVFNNTKIPADKKVDGVVADNFMDNIKSVVSFYKSKKIPVVAVEPLSNLSDMPPFAAAEDAGRDYILKYYQAYKDLDAVALAESQKVLMAGGTTTNPYVAYLNGKTRLHVEETGGKALSDFVYARDNDAIPFRARNSIIGKLVKFQIDYREKYPNFKYVSLFVPLTEMNNITLFGNKLFADHLHYNIEGNRYVSYMITLTLKDLFDLNQAKITDMYYENVDSFEKRNNITDLDKFNAFMSVFKLSQNPPYSTMLIPYEIDPPVDDRSDIIADQALYRQIKDLDNQSRYADVIDYFFDNGDFEKAHKYALSFVHNYPGLSVAYARLFLTDVKLGRIEEAKLNLKYAYFLSGKNNEIYKTGLEFMKEDEVKELLK